MSINIKIRPFTSALCTQLVFLSVCTIGLINPIQNPAFIRCAISVRLSTKFMTCFKSFSEIWYA